MKDLISVVVTCYNHQDYIEQCLRSIFAQTYRNIELLVLDDGSSDHSAEIIEAVLADSPFPTRFESHENMGVVKRRQILSMVICMILIKRKFTLNHGHLTS